MYIIGVKIFSFYDVVNPVIFFFTKIH